MKKYHLIFALLISITSYSQDNSSINDTPTFPIFGGIKEIEIDLKTFNGSIFIEDEFTKGQVTNTLSQQTHTPFLRYDAYNDAFQASFTKSEVKVNYLKKSPEIEVVYGDYQYKYINFQDETRSKKQGYLKELINVSGTIIYYRQEKKIRLPEKASTNYETDKKGSINNNNYFVIKFNNGVKAEKISKKNITTFFSENLKEKVAQITKEKKLKYKNPEDIKTLAKLLK